MVDVQPFPVSKDLVPHPIDSQPFVSMDGHQVPGMYCIFFWNIKQHVYCVETRPQEQHVYIYIGVIGYVRGQPDVPLPTYPYGKSLYKPYTVGIYGTMGTLLGVHPIVP